MAEAIMNAESLHTVKLRRSLHAVMAAGEHPVVHDRLVRADSTAYWCGNAKYLSSVFRGKG